PPLPFCCSSRRRRRQRARQGANFYEGGRTSLALSAWLPHSPEPCFGSVPGWIHDISATHSSAHSPLRFLLVESARASCFAGSGDFALTPESPTEKPGIEAELRTESSRKSGGNTTPGDSELATRLPRE